MSVEREIGDLIRAIARETKESVCAATVTSVEGNTCTVERVSDGRKLEKVSLNSSSNEKDSLIITPAENSQVLIASVDEHHWFVCQYSQIEKVTLNVDNEDEKNMIVIDSGKKIVIKAEDKIEINSEENGSLEISERKVTLNSADKIEINGKEHGHGGLVIIGELHKKLKDLEDKFNKHTHSGSFSGRVNNIPASGTLTIPATAGISNNFQPPNSLSDYENKDVTH
jgi:hypothetical protein